jgi:hypothetical protein
MGSVEEIVSAAQGAAGVVGTPAGRELIAGPPAIDGR